MQEDAEVNLKKWQDDIEERELAEKRRVAPGWLDREEKILEPERKAGITGDGSISTSRMEANARAAVEAASQPQTSEGEELDRAFGGMSIG